MFTWEQCINCQKEQLQNSIAGSSLKVRSSKKLLINFICKSIWEKANKGHLLQLNLMSNDIEVKLIKEAFQKKINYRCCHHNFSSKN